MFRSTIISKQSWALATLLIFGLGLAGLAWPFLNPVDSALPAMPTFKQEEKRPIANSWTVEEFRGLWDKQLLKPPPPFPIAEAESKPAVSEPTPPPPPPPLKLLSVLYSESARIAVFSAQISGQKETVRLRAGESAFECELLKIEPRQVEVKFQGRTFTLSLEQ